MQNTYPMLRWYMFLARFGVCFGVAFRGYASGPVEVRPPLKSSYNQIIQIKVKVFP